MIRSADIFLYKEGDYVMVYVDGEEMVGVVTYCHLADYQGNPLKFYLVNCQDGSEQYFNSEGNSDKASILRKLSREELVAVKLFGFCEVWRKE
jgi:hypothetical protein